MLQEDFLSSQLRHWRAEQKLSYRARRIFGWALFTLVMGFGFCIFGWTAANIPAPETSPNFPFPSWVWTACMTVVSVSCLVSACYGVLAFCDAFLKPEAD